MTEVRLAITFQAAGSAPITIARIKNRGLLREAAIAAMSEAESFTEEVSKEDAVFGELQRQETERLRKAIETVLPELHSTDEVNPWVV
jgi:hypothetical protein